MNTIPFVHPYHTVILANGDFPKHPVPLSYLNNCSRIICCDGATEALTGYGFQPDYIVGDLDSLPLELQQKYSHLLQHDSGQDTNDLTKAVRFCKKRQWDEITILGATGKREDHSVGNISLLADYAGYVRVQMITDHGVFVPLLQSGRFESCAGQQVSVFSVTADTLYSFHGLKYPVTEQALPIWWQGTLNEAIAQEFTIEMNHGKALVFREHVKI